MSDAAISNWGKGTLLSVEALESLHDLNYRFLNWAAERAGSYSLDWIGADLNGLPARLASLLAPLSRGARESAAQCPYALFDLRFHDQSYWHQRLRNFTLWRVSECSVDSDTEDFVRLALFFSWHVACHAQFAAQLLLGMSETTVNDFRRLRVNEVTALVATESMHLTAKWSQSGAYWNALVGAAARRDASGLRRAQLSGLQLAAFVKLDELQMPLRA